MAHRKSAQQPPGNRDDWRKETLARRATDDRLARLGAAPLPASFDRLGKTAVMWSAIEYDLNRRGVVIDRSGMSGRVCETYPTAALVTWGLGKKKPTLELIERAFPWLEIDDSTREDLSTDDACDALVCALMARGRVLGLTTPHTESTQAEREGWIHVVNHDARALLDLDRAQGWLKARLTVPTSEDLAEDGPKQTFDYWREDGTQIDSLAEYANALATGMDFAAGQIASYPFPAAVPARLSRQAHLTQ